MRIVSNIPQKQHTIPADVLLNASEDLFHFKLKVKFLSKYLRGFTYAFKLKGFLLCKYSVKRNGDTDAEK